MSMFAVLALVLAPVRSTRPTDVMPPLVSTAWLAQRLGDPTSSSSRSATRAPGRSTTRATFPAPAS